MLAHNAKLKINHSHTPDITPSLKRGCLCAQQDLPMLFTAHPLLCKKSLLIHSKKIFF